MIDDDINKLIERDSRIDLQTLEADIWRLEAGIRAGQKVSRSLASWQGLVIVLAVLSSASVGISTAMNSANARPGNVLVPGENLAPSSLLFGAQR
jgi:hypothetical protein